MRQPGRFTSAVSASTPVMSVAYLALGAIGYWSQGMGVQEIIIFGTGYDTWSRIAAGAILFQVSKHTAPGHVLSPEFSSTLFKVSLMHATRTRHCGRGIMSRLRTECMGPAAIFCIFSMGA